MFRYAVPVLASLSLTACVVAGPPAPPVRVGVTAPPPAVVRAPDPYCEHQRREAREATRDANHAAQEANYYGGQRAAYEARVARQDANRERAEAARACS